MICSIAAAIAGRSTHAEKIARRIERRIDKVATLCGETADAFFGVRRRAVSDGAAQLSSAATEFSTLGYVEIARLLEASAAALQELFEGDASGPLTRSEQDVLRRLAAGSTPKEIAAADGRSIYTVQAHIANAIAKLGCHGRHEAVALAQRKGLLR